MEFPFSADLTSATSLTIACQRSPTYQSGALSLDELRAILNEASKEFSHLEEHARFLDAKSNRFGGLLKKFVSSESTPSQSPL